MALAIDRLWSPGAWWSREDESPERRERAAKSLARRLRKNPGIFVRDPETRRRRFCRTSVESLCVDLLDINAICRGRRPRNPRFSGSDLACRTWTAPDPADRPRLLRDSLLLARRVAHTHPDPSEGLARAAVVLSGALLLIHPFGNGNGRTARVIGQLLANGFDKSAKSHSLGDLLRDASGRLAQMQALGLAWRLSALVSSQYWGGPDVKIQRMLALPKGSALSSADLFLRDESPVYPAALAAVLRRHKVLDLVSSKKSGTLVIQGVSLRHIATPSMICKADELDRRMRREVVENYLAGMGGLMVARNVRARPVRDPSLNALKSYYLGTTKGFRRFSQVKKRQGPDTAPSV